MYLFIYLASCNTAHVTLSSQLPQMGRLLLLSVPGARTKVTCSLLMTWPLLRVTADPTDLHTHREDLLMHPKVDADAFSLLTHNSFSSKWIFYVLQMNVPT